MVVPVVLHQAVTLNIDHAQRAISGWTRLRCSVPAGATSLGLHSRGLVITSVEVDDCAAEFLLDTPALPHLDSGAKSVADAADKAYWSYITTVARERDPELTVLLPGGAHGGTAHAPSMQATTPTLTLPAGDAPPSPPPPAAPPLPGGAVPGTPPPRAMPRDEDVEMGYAGAAVLPLPPPLRCSDAVTPPAACHTATPGSVAGATGLADSRRVLTLLVAFCSEPSQPSTPDAASTPSTPSTPYASPVTPAVTMFSSGFTVAETSLRRARAVFPCVDAPGSHHPLDMHVLVALGHRAVCAGSLVRHSVVLSPGTSAPLCSHFHFSVPFMATPGSCLIASGPLTPLPQHTHARTSSTQQRILSDLLGKEGAEKQAPTITHLCVPGRESATSHTTAPLYLPFEEFQRYLGCAFPMRQLHFAFLPADCLSVPVQIGAGVVLMSEDLLAEEGEVEGSMEARVALASALARQWFGVLLVPRAPHDEWVAEGLAAHLEDLFVRQLLGANETMYRRHKEREAVILADNGLVPPLCPRQYGAHGAAGAEYGATYGTECLEPGSIRRWKAAAVMRMLERKAGEDQFQRLLRSIVAKAAAAMAQQAAGHHARPGAAAPGAATPMPNADTSAGVGAIACGGGTPSVAGGGGAAAAAAAAGVSSGMDPRLLSTSHFLELVGKLGGFKKGIQAFAERWIYGCGCPHLTLERHYIRSRNVLELRVTQAGSAACRAGALRAAKKQGADDSTMTIKVVVHETDGLSESIVKLGPYDSVVEQEVLLVSRPTGAGAGAGGGRGGGRWGGAGGGRGRGRGRGRGGGRSGDDAALAMDTQPPPAVDATDPAGAGAAGAAAPGAVVLAKEPVLYMRVDPDAQWLCGVTVVQDAEMWATQLERSRDVVAQARAVAGIAQFCKSFCRVRAEAALMLGAGSSDLDSFEGLRHLCDYWSLHARDPVTKQLRPNCFADLAEHLVAQQVPMAAAQSGFTCAP
ncbi:hypothetical protein FOA52_005909 [Chlamydomonas sp. UWO 241]|nr:hypothetical protein FOA52_005909 [Chlamydomonas sp. UWO 241]